MTDPLALEPILGPLERGRPRRSTTTCSHDERYALFEEHVAAGGKVEATDWMPDEYRTAGPALRRDARQQRADGRPARARVDHARADAAPEARPDRQGPGRGRPRPAAVPRRRGPRQAARGRCSTDLLAGKTKFHNVFHYPTRRWADVGIIAWLVDAAAIVAQQALRDSSYAPYARTMRKICWEESVHIMHGRDVVVTHGHRDRRAAGGDPGRARPLVGPAHADARPAQRRAKDRDLHWRIKAKTSEELRQEFLTIYVPRIRELGLVDPGPGAAPRRGDRASGATPSPTGTSCARSSPTTGRCREAAPRVPAARPRGRRAGSATRSSGVRGGRHERRRPADRARDAAPGARGLGGLPPGEGRRPDAPRRQRHGARRGARASTTPARCTAGARRASGCGSSAGPTSIDLDDPDLLQPPLDRSFKKPGGYVMRDKLAAAREQSGQAKPKARAK